MTSFSDLGLIGPLLQALAAEGYETPTPIQARAIPPLLEGRDLLGIAQTGTGKTAAFALPILQKLAAEKRSAPHKGCRVLVLSPTRELASQIAASFRTYGRHLKLSVAVIFGGVPHGGQIRALQGGVDVLVATPGRLLDHVASRNADLRNTEVFVLDEADQMLDLGFFVAIRKIVKHLPAARQNLFFSATMPGEIGKLAAELLRAPVEVAIKPAATTAERVSQQVMLVEAASKRGLLIELLKDPVLSRVLVFTRTKRGADKVAVSLAAAGINASAIHGNKSQSQRVKALESFRRGQMRVLVATDIAARGIDIDGVSHVVNFELPDVPESYVHRIGRTARAGAAGTAIAFCDAEERSLLRDIERVTRQRLPVVDRRALGTHQAAEAETRPRAPAPQPHRSHGKPSHKGGRPQGHGYSGQKGAPEGQQGERRHGAPPHAKPAQRPGKRPGAHPGNHPGSRSGMRPKKQPQGVARGR